VVAVEEELVADPKEPPLQEEDMASALRLERLPLLHEPRRRRKPIRKVFVKILYLLCLKKTGIKLGLSIRKGT
jgi:hypothetical protein